MPHALAAHLGASDLDAALVADDALIADSLVFAAMALPILCRTENLFAEQTVLFGLGCPVIYGLGLGDFSVRPLSDFFRGSDTYLY